MVCEGMRGRLLTCLAPNGAEIVEQITVQRVGLAVSGGDGCVGIICSPWAGRGKNGRQFASSLLSLYSCFLYLYTLLQAACCASVSGCMPWPQHLHGGFWKQLLVINLGAGTANAEAAVCYR